MRAPQIAAGVGGPRAGPRRRGDSGRRGDSVLLAAGAVVAAAAVTAYLAAIAAHPMAAMLKGFDLRVYLGGARQALRHQGDLYTWTYDGHPGIRFTYTPFAALLFSAGLAVPFTALMGLVTVVSVAALCVTVAIAFRELGWRAGPRLGAAPLVAGLALWTEPAQRALFLGQVELVLMALVTWDLCQPDGRRLKGAATGLAAGVKLVPLLFIVYLSLIGRWRQAGVAAGTFALTAAIGAIAFPSASATWWLGGDFLRAGRTGFVAGQQNQSLRGALARLTGSVNGSQAAWLTVAVVVALAGLAAAAALHRRGAAFAGLMTCALTALLVSPVSWDHHWVWIAPGLALITDAGRRARAAKPPVSARRPPRPGLTMAGPSVAASAWYGLAAVTWGLFAAWPRFWAAGAGLLQGGLIGYAPATAWAYGDSPGYAEYHWHGLQLVAGNLELLAGLALFAIALAAAFCRPRPPRPRLAARAVTRLSGRGRPWWFIRLRRRGGVRAVRAMTTPAICLDCPARVPRAVGPGAAGTDDGAAARPRRTYDERVACGGVVLAGGRSSRMGAPKAALEWHGSTLLYRTVAIVARATGGPVVVVRARGQRLPELPGGAIVVDDPREGRGPVQGIAAGLAAVAGQAEAAFVASTDLPFLHPAFVHRVLSALRGGPDVVLPVARGHRQPLAAAYRTSLAGLAGRLVEEERLKPAFLFAGCAVARLDDTALLSDPALARFDPGLDSVLNVNTPGEYRAARRRQPPEVTVRLAGAGQEPGTRRVRAATVGEAAGAVGLPWDRHLAASLNGGRAANDPQAPLATGDAVLFLPAGAPRDGSAPRAT